MIHQTPQTQQVVQAPPLRNRTQKPGAQAGSQQVLVITGDSVIEEGGDVIIETAEEHSGPISVHNMQPNMTSTPLPANQRSRTRDSSNSDSQAHLEAEPVPVTTRTRKQDLSAASKRILPDDGDQDIQQAKKPKAASETVTVPSLRSTRAGSRSTAASHEPTTSVTKSVDQEGIAEDSSQDEVEYQSNKRGRPVRGSRTSTSHQDAATDSEEVEDEGDKSPPRKSGRRPQPK